MTIDTKYNLFDTVLLKEIKRPGIVLQIIIGDIGIQYQVAYWNDGVRKVEWLLEKEIE